MAASPLLSLLHPIHRHRQQHHLCFSLPSSSSSFHLQQSLRLHNLPALAKPLAVPSKKSDHYQPPLPGAVTFKRSALQTHFELGTTLESLGLSKLSSDLSRSVALSMGLHDDRKAPQEVTATPVVVSVDVSKEERNLRLDGILRTAIALRCNRCLGPATERVFANFSLLLTEEPPKRPTKKTAGIVLGNPKGVKLREQGDDGEESLDLYLDDKLYFPKYKKEIDISKYIRDTVHLEIPLRALCTHNCKGLCLNCGVNLNKSGCKCQPFDQVQEERTRKDNWSSLEELKKKMEVQQQRD